MRPPRSREKIVRISWGRCHSLPRGVLQRVGWSPAKNVGFFARAAGNGSEEKGAHTRETLRPVAHTPPRLRPRWSQRPPTFRPPADSSPARWGGWAGPRFPLPVGWCPRGKVPGRVNHPPKSPPTRPSSIRTPPIPVVDSFLGVLGGFWLIVYNNKRLGPSAGWWPVRTMQGTLLGHAWVRDFFGIFLAIFPTSFD